MCPETDKFKNIYFFIYYKLYIAYNILFLRPNTLKQIFKKKIKSIIGVCSSKDELKCHWC